MSVTVAYMSVFRGLRRHFAERDGLEETAAYSAVCAISFMVGICVSSIAIIIDNLTAGEIGFVEFTSENRLIAIAIILLLLAAHVVVARRLGLFSEPLPDKPASWALQIKLLMGVCGICIAAVLAVMLT